MAEKKVKVKAKEVKDSDSKKSHSLPSEKEVAMDFAMKVHQKFDRLVKATVLFGSQAKQTAGPESDIDIIIIIDDASLQWDLELIAWYREELNKIMSSMKHDREFHINTIKLTTWWQDLMYGDPVIINILRYGEVLIDSGGFFLPVKMLLQSGKIRSTHEAVYAALQRAPQHLYRSRSSKLGAIEGLYWCMVDSAQAALIIAGKLPPSPEHIPGLLTETFVNPGLLKDSKVSWIREIYALHKAIIHGSVHNIKGQDLDMWYDRAEKFLSDMTDIIDSVISSTQQN